MIPKSLLPYEKRKLPHSLSISEIIDSEKCGYLNV